MKYNQTKAKKTESLTGGKHEKHGRSKKREGTSHRENVVALQSGRQKALEPSSQAQ